MMCSDKTKKEKEINSASLERQKLRTRQSHTALVSGITAKASRGKSFPSFSLVKSSMADSKTLYSAGDHRQCATG